MSLSFFLRDYLYHSMGGDRVGRWKTGRNMLVVWFLGGLWHGAAWHFVAWGIWHGGLILVGRLLGASRLGVAWEAAPFVLRVGWTFMLVTLGWVLFRATSLDSAGAIYGAMLSPWRPGWLAGVDAHYLQKVALVALAGVAHVISYRMYASDPTGTVLLRMPYPVQVAAVALSIAMILVFAGEARRFIYFDF